MSIDLEADLRREFDAAGSPSDLTFNPKFVLSQGNRTIRRHRIVAVGSAAMAVALVATGASLLTRPRDTSLRLPASSSATTGIVRSQFGFVDGTFEVEFNRDTSVKSNVHFFFTPPGGQKKEVGSMSTGKPGQKPDAAWKSATVDGHPFTIGLAPGTSKNVHITFADGTNHGVTHEELQDTGYTWFVVKYEATAQPTDIASIRWSLSGVVDGVEGDRRLTGRVLPLNKAVAVEVVLRPGNDGQITVFGRTLVYDNPGDPGNAGTYATDLSLATTDQSGAAVVTGRQPMVEESPSKGANDAAPIAAGVLPPGASEIGVYLRSGDSATGLAVQQRLPDGRVIFAMSAGFAHPDDPGKDSIKAVTWTNADGTQGRIDVTQKQS